MWCIDTMEYEAARRKYKIMSLETIGMELEGIMLNEINKIKIGLNNFHNNM